MNPFSKLQKGFDGFTLSAFNNRMKLLNVSPGPAQISPKVIKSIATELANNSKFKFGNTPLEISHRSPEFLKIFNSLDKNLRSFMKIPNDFEILWTPGGGHGQFAAIPLNLRNILKADKFYYAVNGTWSNRAFQESKQFVKSENIFENFYDKQENILQYNSMPKINEELINKMEQDSYLYICSNETVNGIEFQQDNVGYPDKKLLKNNKLIVDMSSDFLMKSVNWDNIDVAFACSSKNMGVAGSNVVIIKKDILDELSQSQQKYELPSILNWKLYNDSNSLYNTPSIFNLYLTNKLLFHYKDSGNIEFHNENTKLKGKYVYDFLDSSILFKPCVKETNIRSNINIPFLVNAGCATTRNKFLHYCYTNNIVGLRTKTPFSYEDLNLKEPLRINLYNGVSLEETKKVVHFLQKFENMFFS